MNHYIDLYFLEYMKEKWGTYHERQRADIFIRIY